MFSTQLETINGVMNIHKIHIKIRLTKQHEKKSIIFISWTRLELFVNCYDGNLN